jgi:hypothetical protein
VRDFQARVTIYDRHYPLVYPVRVQATQLGAAARRAITEAIQKHRGAHHVSPVLRLDVTVIPVPPMPSAAP